MNLTKEQLDRMVMKDGRVLVLVEEFETTKLGSIHINPVADETRTTLAARSGVVVKVPVNPDIEQMAYDFKGEMEIEVGDKVWWSSNAAGNLLLLKENARFEVEGKEYIVIRQEFDVKPWDGQPDEPVISLPMTSKRAVEAVLHYERLGYFKVSYQKVGQ